MAESLRSKHARKINDAFHGRTFQGVGKSTTDGCVLAVYASRFNGIFEKYIEMFDPVISMYHTL